MLAIASFGLLVSRRMDTENSNIMDIPIVPIALRGNYSMAQYQMVSCSTISVGILSASILHTSSLSLNATISLRQEVARLLRNKLNKHAVSAGTRLNIEPRRKVNGFGGVGYVCDDKKTITDHWLKNFHSGVRNSHRAIHRRLVNRSSVPQAHKTKNRWRAVAPQDFATTGIDRVRQECATTGLQIPLEQQFRGLLLASAQAVKTAFDIVAPKFLKLDALRAEYQNPFLVQLKSQVNFGVFEEFHGNP